MENKASIEGEEGNIRLEIPEIRKDETGHSLANTNRLQSNVAEGDRIDETSSDPGPGFQAPEKKLTLFALRLAVLEKAATGLGTLGFIWATVVLLGGFAFTLDKTDFWIITIILVIEGTRIFSRSHELEWQRQTTWSIAYAGINSFRALRSGSNFLAKTAKDSCGRLSGGFQRHNHQQREVTQSKERPKPGDRNGLRKARTWTSSEVPIIPYAQWFFYSRNISKMFYWLQFLTAITCAVLSLYKLIKHNYGEIGKEDTDKRNRKSALSIFYSLALAEAIVCLVEKIYWEWKLVHSKLLEKVNKDCGFQDSDITCVRRFFYDSYSKCISGSIFDGLGMDMVTFAMDLLASNLPKEQTMGIRILHSFASNKCFCDDTLQKIGITLPVIDRLVEMLNWKYTEEEEIRCLSAEILSKLSGKGRNSLRIAGISGAMESISSLLYTNGGSNFLTDEIIDRNVIHNQGNYEYWKFNNLGLLILKNLAHDHDNCGKIGNTRGLLYKIVELTRAEERILMDDNVAPSHILTIEISLQVLKMMASTTGQTGKYLRKEISDIVFTISNIRDTLRFGEKQPQLQKLGMEILTSLALEEDATEHIGGTGGVLRELLNVFFKEGMPGNQNDVKMAAGEALAMLAFESESNCQLILMSTTVEMLVGALDDPLLCVYAARILRNLCTYAKAECFDRLKRVNAAAPKVVKAIIDGENKLQEAMVGLAARASKFVTAEEFTSIFETAGIKEVELTRALINILRKNPNPTVQTPNIRRFVIELTIWMMTANAKNVCVFKDLKMEEELVKILETTSEIESFNVISGYVGLSRHSTTIHTLVDTALKLLEDT